MTNFRQIKIASFLLTLALVILVDSQEITTEQNNTKNVSLNDPTVDQTIKSALENGSVSEVVVRKDLLLFPVNAPDLVIAHTQEIHAVPQTNGSNSTDGKPTAAEVAEVNEYSLSQLVSTNDTDHDNETKNESPKSAVQASALLRGPQNASVLEPGKLLEIVSGFNMSHGMATEKVALPDEVQNISIPKQSISSLLSKSIQQSDTPVTSTLTAFDVDASQTDSTTVDSLYPDAGDFDKRSIELEENNGTKDSIPPYPYLVRKRSVDSEGCDSDENCSSEDMSAEDELASSADSDDDIEKRSDESDEDNSSINEENDKSSEENDKQTTKDVGSSVNVDDISTIGYETTSSSSTIADTSLLDSVKMVRRSVDLDEETDITSTSTNEYNFYNNQVEDSIEKLDVASTPNNSTYTDYQPAPTNNKPSNWIHNMKEKLRENSPENMEVAEDIIFRPLFRYRQETRMRQEAARRRNSGHRKPAYNDDDSDYDDRYRTNNVYYK